MKIKAAEEYERLSVYLEDEFISDISSINNKAFFLNAIKSTNSREGVENFFFKQIIRDYCNALAMDYCKCEGLETDYIKLATSSTCQESLICNILFNHANVIYERKMEEEVKYKIQSLINDVSASSPFYRTKCVQECIYDMVDKYGKRDAKFLDKLIMRKTLSISRLGFIISDLLNSDKDEIKKIIETTDGEAMDDSGSDYRRDKNKKYIHNWNYNNIKFYHGRKLVNSLDYYEDILNKIYEYVYDVRLSAEFEISFDIPQRFTVNDDEGSYSLTGSFLDDFRYKKMVTNFYTEQSRLITNR
jgi:predicted nucleic-acid-binding protein